MSKNDNDRFNLIKTFILKDGDKQTYCNMYNNNPHYNLNDFQIYLNPSIGQKNISCDPKLSDFNEIVVHDISSEDRYYRIKLNNDNTVTFDPQKSELYFNKICTLIDECNQNNKN
ncbi:unnamed protein product [Didymodactylos carnosus]|uniref:Uncharacterized protein n=1 Tax=Didymodactylos carnosus TaxID=1234261 RepID=A0A814VVR8_9BILA|nr:unnamed protein product [Didymodactylos carnosus]CAF1194147.1 unnamed protein product [Didymodactylos carnosus]CAF3958496.1 unnamed protein product [Didymodactylos carnosus]CAF3966774.1 unnamed protein product [Didymodactylos carnosus]